MFLICRDDAFSLPMEIFWAYRNNAFKRVDIRMEVVGGV